MPILFPKYFRSNSQLKFGSKKQNAKTVRQAVPVKCDFYASCRTSPGRRRRHCQTFFGKIDIAGLKSFFAPLWKISCLRYFLLKNWNVRNSKCVYSDVWIKKCIFEIPNLLGGLSPRSPPCVMISSLVSCLCDRPRKLFAICYFSSMDRPRNRGCQSQN